MKTLFLKDEEATLGFGSALSLTVRSPIVIYLKGPIGAGKTTLVRGFLRGKGVAETIKSPTFTLVEAYPLATETVYHFDCYRILDPKELQEIGISEYFHDQSVQSIVFIEWPEKAKGFIPKADLEIELIVEKQGRKMIMEWNSLE